jgi:hypothetical protein
LAQQAIRHHSGCHDAIVSDGKPVARISSSLCSPKLRRAVIVESGKTQGYWRPRPVAEMAEMIVTPVCRSHTELVAEMTEIAEIVARVF